MINKSYNLANISSMIPVINETILMYIKGNSAKMVSKKLSISVNDVYKILQDNEIPLRKGNSNDGIQVLRNKKEGRKPRTPKNVKIEDSNENTEMTATQSNDVVFNQSEDNSNNEAEIIPNINDFIEDVEED